MQKGIFVSALWSIFLAAAIASASANDTAPVKVTVGDGAVNGAKLQPYKNAWGMSVIKPDGTVLPDVGVWEDLLEVVNLNGRECFQRTQIARYKKNGEVVATTTTINVFDRKTMAPISRSFERHGGPAGDKRQAITFGKDSMKIETTVAGKPDVKDVPATSAFDFYGGLYAVLWVALPLKNGYLATLPSYSEDEDHPEKVSWVTFQVTGSETTEAGAKGKVQAWVVNCDSDIGNLKYWVSEESPYIIRMDYKQKNGPTWILKMI